ncbi:hypothetical protein [Thermogemmatispora onikobensis]|uniref:hypothetical protein n=1 Tax=Thermogemmatispora onikobensis TaxID=732234 RepID=UPI000853676B|nr:hypothetical protein [Thermogemmatispora onikobensis]
MSLDDLIAELKQTDAARALIEEGLQQGIQQGIQQAFQQGRQQALQQGREDFVTGVRSCFPQLEPLATTVAAHIHSLRTIHQLLLMIGQAPDAEHLRALLLPYLLEHESDDTEP